jgi:FKBP-type peptidyl-prolyl cis-trans isomerase
MKTFLTIFFTLVIAFFLSYFTVRFLGYKIDLKKIGAGNREVCQPQEKLNETSNMNNATNQAANTPTEIKELMAQIIQPGSGAQKVQAGDTITVHYTGTLINGTKFDSSVDRGQPFQLVIGVGQVIPGWDQGIIGMQVGEKRKLFIPANLAYGEQGAGTAIPPNSPLIFEVELLSIDKTSAASAATSTPAVE